MSEVLELEHVAEVVSCHQDDWNFDLGVLYVQSRQPGTIDLVGNKALRPYLGHIKIVPEASLGSWVRTLSAAQPLAAVGTADLSLLGWLVDTAISEQWDVPLRRVVRLGDCRGSASFGTGAEQAAAERILAANPSHYKQIALVEVAGTHALLSETSFKWEADDEYPVKSCYKFDDVCALVIPSLILSKGVGRILVAGEDLMRKLARDSRLSPYKSVFEVKEDPDRNAVALRRKVIAEIERRLICNKPASAPKRRWLDVVRKTLAPGGGSSTAEIMELYFRALKTDDSRQLEVALEKLSTLASEPNPSVALFAQGVACLARSRLGHQLSDVELDHLLTTGIERELWWNAAMQAETLSWARSQRSGEWLTRLGERGVPALAQAARDSASAYTHVRVAVRDFMPAKLMEIAPFESFEAHENLNHSLLAVREALRDGNESRGADTIDWTSNEVAAAIDSLDSCFTKTIFYSHMEDIFWYIDLAHAIEFSSAARQLWGDCQEQRKLELNVAFASDKFEDTIRLGTAHVIESPDDYLGWHALAETYQTLKQYGDAIRSYERMRALSPERQYPIREIARCQSLGDDNPSAIAVLESIPEPTREQDTSLMLARLYSYERQYSRARQILASIDPAILDARTLMTLVTNAAALDPWPTAHAQLLANRERLAGEWPQAIELVAYAFANRGDAGLAVKSLVSELGFGRDWNSAAISLAHCLNHLGRADEAEKIYLRREDPDEDILSERAAMHYERGNFSSSFDIATNGLALCPDARLLIIVTGELGELFGSPSPTAFQRVIELLESIEPANRSLHDNHLLAIAYFNVGNTIAADQLINTYPTPGASWLLFSAMAAAIAGQEARCTAQYEKAIMALAVDEPLWREKSVRGHLADIEVYGRRGRLPDWETFQAQARDKIATRS